METHLLHEPWISFSRISAKRPSGEQSFFLQDTLCGCVRFIQLFPIRGNARVVNERHGFGWVSGGSDFPAGQMAALCGQRLCVDEGLREEGQQPRGGRIAHALALSSVPVQLCFSLHLELLMCSICGRGHWVKQNTCLVAEARQAGVNTVRSSCCFSTCQSLLRPSDGGLEEGLVGTR